MLLGLAWLDSEKTYFYFGVLPKSICGGCFWRIGTRYNWV